MQHIIQFNREDRVKFIALLMKEGWSSRYLGDNEFVVTEEQIKKIKSEGILFKETTSNGLPSPKKPAVR
jgi:hypothetical protein